MLLPSTLADGNGVEYCHVLTKAQPALGLPQDKHVGRHGQLLAVESARGELASEENVRPVTLTSIQ
eukprot:scaffold177_cov334-Pavlova_lutheri.AAC.98